MRDAPDPIGNAFAAAARLRQAMDAVSRQTYDARPQFLRQSLFVRETEEASRVAALPLTARLEQITSWRTAAAALSEAGQWEDAIELQERCVAMLWYLRNVDATWRRSGIRDADIREVNEALDAESATTVARTLLVSCLRELSEAYAATEQFNTALETGKAALRVRDDDVPSLCTVARILLEHPALGSDALDEAEAVLRRAEACVSSTDEAAPPALHAARARLAELRGRDTATLAKGITRLVAEAAKSAGDDAAPAISPSDAAEAAAPSDPKPSVRRRGASAAFPEPMERHAAQHGIDLRDPRIVRELERLDRLQSGDKARPPAMPSIRNKELRMFAKLVMEAGDSELPELLRILPDAATKVAAGASSDATRAAVLDVLVSMDADLQSAEARQRLRVGVVTWLRRLLIALIACVVLINIVRTLWR